MYPITGERHESDHRIGGCSVRELVSTYGTPLYVVDEATLRYNCQQFTTTLRDHYPNATVAYASKAGLTVGIANIIASEQLGADVVSGGELYTILQSRVDPERVYFHGNNKSGSEIDLAIRHCVTIVVDNAHELAHIQAIATDLQQPARVLFRLNPGIDVHTHRYIKTGHGDSKFGLTVDEAIPLMQRVVAGDWAVLRGIHAHIGSQIMDEAPFQMVVRWLVATAATLIQVLNHPIDAINCGGGFGISYTAGDTAPNIPRIIHQMTETLKQSCAEHAIPLPRLIVEPGRSIIGNAGVTLYTIGAVKSVPQGSQYIFVDGGMADNPRFMMYQSAYTFDVISAEPSLQTGVFKIAGKFCESGDVLADGVTLPVPQPNDIMIVYGTGAYNYSMSSNYNRYCKPAMVLVNNGTSRVLVKRETYADIVRHDMP